MRNRMELDTSMMTVASRRRLVAARSHVRVAPAAARILAALAFGLVAILGVPRAQADEIKYRDLETCEEKSMTVFEIDSEDQTTVYYRDRKGARDLKEMPTKAIVRIRRGDANDKEAVRIDEARSEIRSGNYDAAIASLRAVHGGGYYTNLETQERVFTPYNQNDPSGRNKRPRWQSEYAHFLALKALYLKGSSKKDRAVLEEALAAAVDVPVTVIEKKGDKSISKSSTSGGFLVRFAGGTSRWFPEAQLIHAHILRDLGQMDKAAAEYKAVYETAVREKLHPKIQFEAALGPGRIAEAKNDLRGAIQAYNGAGSKLMQLLGVEQHACLRKDLGRYYSLARIQAVRVQLADAEKTGAGNKAKFRQLRSFIEQGSPESLGKQFATKSKSVREALISGARSAEVQAVALTGVGRAHMIEGQLEAAMLAFKEVTVKHFKLRDQAAQASAYLAQAAASAAKEAKGETRKLYESWRDQAREALKTTYRDTEWGRK